MNRVGRLGGDGVEVPHCVAGPSGAVESPRTPRGARAGTAGRGCNLDLAQCLADTDRRLERLCAQLEEQWAGLCREPTPVLDVDLPARMRGWLFDAPGKRLRPMLCHTGWCCAAGPATGGWQDLVTVCAALDVVHLFAVVHDDVMDRSTTRRGRATTHTAAARAHRWVGGSGDPVLFGDSVAVLFGDLLLSEAWCLIAQLPAPLAQAWAKMLRELVHGQLLDVTGAAAGGADLDRAGLVARLKSGAYTVQRPLQLGARAAGAAPGVLAALGECGSQLGEAFALRDDILGVWGDPEDTGKPVGDDLVSGKPTVLLALARDLMDPVEVARYVAPGGAITPGDVPTVQALMVDAGVRECAEERIGRLVRGALGAAQHAHLQPGGMEQLSQLIDQIAWRDA